MYTIRQAGVYVCWIDDFDVAFDVMRGAGGGAELIRCSDGAVLAVSGRGIGSREHVKVAGRNNAERIRKAIKRLRG